MNVRNIKKLLKLENVENGDEKFHILLLECPIFKGFRGRSVKKKIGE